jgi:hypothetical protein
MWTPTTRRQGFEQEHNRDDNAQRRVDDEPASGGKHDGTDENPHSFQNSAHLTHATCPADKDPRRSVKVKLDPARARVLIAILRNVAASHASTSMPSLILPS